jgi:hypothetical protein
MAITIDGTNGISDVDGSAATPAIRGTDTNTGIFFPAVDTIAFAEGGAESMRIDSSGNVGIGTSTPDAKFKVVASGANLLIGYGGTANYYDASTHTFRNFAGTNYGMFDSAGNLLVGQTARGVVSSNSFNLDIQSAQLYCNHASGVASSTGYVTFGYAAGTIGSITQSGTTAVAYNTSSDYRLKEQVTPMTGALATVGQLKPVTYKWKSDGSDGQGFIAHELAEVVPDCVTGEKDAVETYIDEEGNEQTRQVYQGIDTSFLVATLTAAIQEQQAIITEQANAITALEARLTALEIK